MYEKKSNGLSGKGRKCQHIKAENERKDLNWKERTVKYGRKQRRSKKSDQLYLNYQDSKINLGKYF